MKKVNIGILVVGGIVASLLLGMYGVQTSLAASAISGGAQSGTTGTSSVGSVANGANAGSAGCSGAFTSSVTGNTTLLTTNCF